MSVCSEWSRYVALSIYVCHLYRASMVQSSSRLTCCGPSLDGGNCHDSPFLSLRYVASTVSVLLRCCGGEGMRTYTSYVEEQGWVGWVSTK